MAGAITIRTHHRDFERQLRRATLDGLKRAAIFYHTKCRLAVSKSNTDRYVTKWKDSSGKKRSRTIYRNMHNLWAGKPPRLRTGFGRSQIVWESNDSTADPAVRIGVTLAGIYMIFLELGTRLIKPRPWLLATLMRFMDAIGMLAVTSMRNRMGGGREH